MKEYEAFGIIEVRQRTARDIHQQLADEILAAKGYKKPEDVHNTLEREELQAEFKVLCETKDKEFKLEADKQRKMNVFTVATFGKQKLKAVLEAYTIDVDALERGNMNDYIIGLMVAHGVISYSYKKNGKAYGKVKGAELSVNSWPILIKWQYGSLKGEIDTALGSKVSLGASYFEGKVLQKVYNDIVNKLK